MSVDVRECLESVVKDFGEPELKGASAPAKRDLMDVDLSSSKVEDPRRQKLHGMAMKLTRVARRRRKDA